MISFQNHNIKRTLKNKSLLKQWIESTIQKKKRSCGRIGFVFCSDEYLLGMNKQYLNHDTYTDIITFDYSKGDLKQAVSGDILISVDRVNENSKTFSKSFESELHRVMIHGILHLLGYNDKTGPAKAEMRKQEDLCLRALGKKANRIFPVEQKKK